MKKAIILSVLTAMSLGIAGCGEKNTVSSGVSGSVFENSAVISDKAETTAKETQLTSVSAEQTVTDANQPAAEASAEENTDYESIKPFVGLWIYQVPQNTLKYNTDIQSGSRGCRLIICLFWVYDLILLANVQMNNTPQQLSVNVSHAPYADQYASLFFSNNIIPYLFMLLWF